MYSFNIIQIRNKIHQIQARKKGIDRPCSKTVYINKTWFWNNHSYVLRTCANPVNKLISYICNIYRIYICNNSYNWNIFTTERAINKFLMCDKYPYLPHSYLHPCFINNLPLNLYYKMGRWQKYRNDVLKQTWIALNEIK